MRTDSLTHATEGFRPCQGHFHLPFQSHVGLLSSRSRLSGAASVQTQPELVGPAGGRALWAAHDPIGMAVWGAWPAPPSCPTEPAAAAGRRREQSLGSTIHHLPTALLPFIFKKCSGAASPLLGQAMKQPPRADPPLRRGMQSCPRRGAARRQSSNLPLPGGRLPSGALGLCTAQRGRCRDRGCSGKGRSWSNAGRGGRLSVIFLYLE